MPKECCGKPYVIEDTVLGLYGGGSSPSTGECIASEAGVCLMTESSEDLIIE